MYKIRIFIAVLGAMVLANRAQAVDAPTTQPDAAIVTQSTISAISSEAGNGTPKLVLFFPTGTALLPENQKTAIQPFGNYLQQNPKATAEIRGHADNTGRNPINNDLAQKRADALRNYLVSTFNIAGDRIKAHGYGEISDKVSNSTGEAKQMDRRVIAVIHNHA